MRTSSKILSLVVISCFSSGCYMSGNILGEESLFKISGTFLVPVTPLASQSVTCTNPVAKIYQIDASGSKTLPALKTTTLSADGTYEFDMVDSGLSMDESVTTATLVVNIEGCSTEYGRPITRLAEQDIDYGSTLISYLTDANQGSILASKLKFKKPQIEKLINSLNLAHSLMDAYNLLQTNPSLKAEFVSIFNQDPLILTKMPPKLVSQAFPASGANEGSPLALSAQTSHWYTAYPVMHIWSFRGQPLTSSVGHTSNINSPLGKNNQGSGTLTLQVGADDGFGSLDTSAQYLYETFEKPFTVNNVYPAVVPSVTRTSASPTQSLNVTLSIATGAALVNCETFSHLALTVDDVIAPILPLSYNLDCGTAPAQPLAQVLSAGEGTRTLRLWTIDSALNISTLPQVVTLVVDQSAPALTLTSPPAVLAANAVYTINYTASDLTAFSTLKLQYSTDGVTYTDIASVLASNTTHPWTTPASAGSTVTLRLTGTDSVGLSSTVTSSVFSLDSTPPTAPVITRVTASPTSTVATTVSNANCNDSANGFFITESATPPQANDAGWVACAVGNYNLNVSAGSGTKTIYAYLKDPGGNVSLPSTVSVILDLSGPTLSLIEPNAGALKANSPVTIIWSSSDPNAAAGPVSLEYTIDGTTWLPIVGTQAATGSYAFTTPNIDNELFRVRVTAVDTFANSTQVVSSSAIILDKTAPTITDLKIFNDIGTTSSRLFDITFSAIESQSVGKSKVNFICLKSYNTSNPVPTAPANMNDPCWSSLTSVSITPADTISNALYGNLLTVTAYLSDTYTVRGWVADTVGNISGGHVGDSIDYIQPIPATLVNAQAGNSDAMAYPVVPAMNQVNLSSNVFIKWKASAGSNSFTVNPVKIFYTQDAEEWFELDSGVGKGNSANAGCSVDANYTGCYVWNNSVSSSYLKFRIDVTDVTGASVTSETPWINKGNFRELAGNQSFGIGGVAPKAVFVSHQPYGDERSLAVTQSKIVYFNMSGAGIVQVKPTDAKVTLIVKKSAAASVDGLVGTATTLAGTIISEIDSQDRLVFMEFTGADAKLRRFDPATNTTITLAGGGVSNVSGTIGTSVNLSGVETCQGRPNRFFMDKDDNVYFLHCTSNLFSTARLGKYQASDQKVYFTTFTGTSGYYATAGGLAYSSSLVFNAEKVSTFFVKFDSNGVFDRVYIDMENSSAYMKYLTFDVNGSPVPQALAIQTIGGASTGGSGPYFFNFQHSTRTGLAYNLSPGSGTFQKLTSAGTWTNLTTSSNVFGPDGGALSSYGTYAEGFYLSKEGIIYFSERGKIRYIDGNGKLQTLIGEYNFGGDGGANLEARFASIEHLDLRNNGDVYVYDNGYGSLRMAGLASGITTKLAGNTGWGGHQLTLGTLAASQTFQPWTDSFMSFVYNSNNDSVYARRIISGTPRIVRLLPTGYWSIVALGNGSAPTYYPFHNSLSEGLGLLNVIDNSYFTTSMLKAYSPARDRFAMNMSTQSNSNYFLKELDMTNGVFRHLAGLPSSADNSGDAPYTRNQNVGGYPSAGVSVANSVTPYVGYPDLQDDNDNPAGNQGPRWLGAFIDYSGGNRIVGMPVAPGGTLQTVTTTGSRFLSYVYVRKATSNVIYYCVKNATSSATAIKRREISSDDSTLLTPETYLPLPTGVYCTGRNLKWNAARNTLVFATSQRGMNGIAEYYDP